MLKKNTKSSETMSIVDDLLSVVPSTVKTVKIKETDVEIRPIELSEIATILAKYPACLDAFKNGFEDINFTLILKTAPQIINEIVAAGLDEMNNLEEITKIQRLPDDIKLEILSQIVSLTMPGGMDDLLGKFQPLLNLFGVEMESET
jgi:hypothetical protein